MNHPLRCRCGTLQGHVRVGARANRGLCYCRDCQRVSGAGHLTGAMFPVEQITVSGTMAEYRGAAESGSTVSHLFCAKCSSRLFGKNTNMPGAMTVSAGTLNNPDALEPQVAIFTRSRPHWDSIDAGVQAFEAQPAWKPSDGA